MKITDYFIRNLRISQSELWRILEPSLNLDISNNFEALFSCFYSEKDFYDFLSLVCGQENLIEYIYPKVDSTILNTYFAESGAPIHIEDIKEYLVDPQKNSDLIPANTGISDNSVESQIKEYNDMLLKRDKLITGSSNKNPIVIDLNNSLSAMKQTIIRSVDNLIVGLNIQLKNIPILDWIFFTLVVFLDFVFEN